MREYRGECRMRAQVYVAVGTGNWLRIIVRYMSAPGELVLGGFDLIVIASGFITLK